MSAYYNEIDPYAAQWLRNLISAGHIAPGDVDERSIEDVKPDDLRKYTQCHFFAGIGVWSYALRQAGWTDDKPVWTGSCPCQPFSAAGKGDGFDDERHLWPSFFHLIEQRKPSIVFGEQVASKAIDTWIDLVQSDMEGMGYAFASSPFPSAGVGAPHIRDRNFWLAHSERQQHKKCVSGLGKGNEAERGGEAIKPSGFCLSSGVAHCHNHRQQSGTRTGCGSECAATGNDIGGGSEVSRPAYANNQRLQGKRPHGNSAGWQGSDFWTTGLCNGARDSAPACQTNGFWRDADWLLCRDGRWRPVEPGTFPLANGITNRVGRLRAYGNAINAEAAKTFIESYLEAK